MPLDYTLSVDTADTAVTFALTVRNSGTEPVQLTFRDSGIADFAVLTDDEEVWRWSDGKMFAQAIETRELAPGEQLTVDGTWTEPDPGAYTAVGSLRAQSHECEARTPFSV